MTTCYPDDESSLIEQALDGDAIAWQKLYGRYSPELYRRALIRTDGNTQEAEDAVQEVWLKAMLLEAWEHREGATFRSFLHRVLHHALVDRYRRNGRRPKSIPYDEGEDDEAGSSRSLAASDDSPEDGLLKKEEYIRVANAVERLPPRRREVLLLRFWSDLNRSGIAEVLGIDPDSVSRYLTRALTQLKPRL